MNEHEHAARQRATYFQVPLCAFAFGKSDKERLNAIISYGLVEAGTTRWSKLTEDQRDALARTWTKGTRPADDFRLGSPRHVFVACSAEVIGVRLGSVARVLGEHDELLAFRNSFESRHGRDPSVRLKAGLVWEARDGTGITPRELAVLAAIYSVIGNKQRPVLITQERIRRRALGYKTATVRDLELPSRKDGAQPLTDWRLRSLLDHLQIRKLFVRATYGRRLTYYSHRMTEAALRKALVEMKTYGYTRRLLRRLDDEALTSAIRNQRAATEGKPPPVPAAGPLLVPGGFGLEDVS